MPFWKKGAEPPSPSDPAVPAGPRPVRGVLACSEYACGRHDAASCAYVDRRGRSCPTAWCPDHQVVMAGRAFCRRHARIFGAVGGGEFQMGQALPDLDNRSPSLADYVGDALEPRVLQFLWSLCRPGTNDQVASEPLRVVHPTGGGSRRWDRTWKIYDHTGVIVQVTVEADRVATRRSTSRSGGTPSARRSRPGSPADSRVSPLAAGADAEERERFYASLWQAAPAQIVLEVEQSRSAIGYLGR